MERNTQSPGSLHNQTQLPDAAWKILQENKFFTRSLRCQYSIEQHFHGLIAQPAQRIDAVEQSLINARLLTVVLRKVTQPEHPRGQEFRQECRERTLTDRRRPENRHTASMPKVHS
ncbi:MAG: hypothetical protein ACRD3Q_02100 [Terriglobales bacterium]